MLNINQYLQKSIFPFPHYVVDNILDEKFAQSVQDEIMNISQEKFDRYSNPFEQKWTLRDKNDMPTNCKLLFDYLQSQECITRLSQLANIQLITDPNKNFWGIHKYDNGDKLDIHVDAGIHPLTKQKKELTLGIYLSKNWKEEFGGHLELWEGENSKNNDAKLLKCVHKVLPSFNRMVLFTCDDYAWHGNPYPVTNDENSMRIFLTMSYLSDRPFTEFENHRQKAFFIKLPNEPHNPEKDKLRLLRADPDKYREIYRVDKM